MNLDDLMVRGLYLSDIPLHDATRELIMVGEQFKEDYKLAQSLEIFTDKLQHTLVAREKEKKMTDKYYFLLLIILSCFDNIKPIKNYFAQARFSFT